MTSSKPRKKILILILAGTVLLAGALTAFFIWLKAYTHVYPIDLNSYVKVVFEGYDETGTAKVVIDKKAFLKDYAGKLRWEDREDRQRGDPAEALFDSVKAQIRENEELENGCYSNGDELEIRWKNRYFANRIANADVSAENFRVRAEGLKEPGTFDAFEQLEVIYDGLDGEGRVIELWEHSGLERTYGLTYRVLARPEGGPLRNGDTITVSVGDLETERNLIRQYGMKPLQMEKAFTVQGLITYTTFDPFEGIVLGFRGRNGEGILQNFINNSPYPACYKLGFRFEPNQGLRNGDEVLVTVFYETWDREDIARNYGMLPDPMEKVFIVSGLTEEAAPEPGGDDSGEDQPGGENPEEVYGVLNGNVYTNEAFGLKAVIPSKFKTYGKGNIPSSVIGGLNDLYAEAGQTETLGIRIQHLSDEEKTKSAREILEAYSREILDIYAANGLTADCRLTEEQFAGKTCACLDVTAEMKVVIVVLRIRHRIYVWKEGSHAIAVSVMAGDEKKLSEYCGYFEALK